MRSKRKAIELNFFAIGFDIVLNLIVCPWVEVSFHRNNLISSSLTALGVRQPRSVNSIVMQLGGVSEFRPLYEFRIHFVATLPIYGTRTIQRIIHDRDTRKFVNYVDWRRLAWNILLI